MRRIMNGNIGFCSCREQVLCNLECGSIEFIHLNEWKDALNRFVRNIDNSVFPSCSDPDSVIYRKCKAVAVQKKAVRAR